MNTFKVRYRVLPVSLPHVSLILSYTVDAIRADLAEQSAYGIMTDDVQHMFGHYDKAWLLHTSTRKLK